MKKVAVYICLITLPVLLFLNIWQSFRYREIETEVIQLESVQKDWLELNKRMLAGLARLNSPSRIEQIALNNIGLEQVEKEQIMRISFTDPGGRNTGDSNE